MIEGKYDKSKYYDHFLEQYKLYVQMTDNISNRRESTNKFYLAILSGLLAALSALKAVTANTSLMIIVASILGICICGAWIVNIRSYKNLNSAKFDVILEMEKRLPYQPYEKEWELIKQKRKRYVRLTHVEMVIPILFALSFLMLIIIVWLN